MPIRLKPGKGLTGQPSNITMYNSAQLAWKYCVYLVKSSSGKGHGVHSPFVFDFITNVLHGKQVDAGFSRIEAKRAFLSTSQQMLDVLDLGAGSISGNSKQRSVSSIARSAAKPAKFAKLLFRMVRYYRIDSVLELGTSLGLTTRYLSLAAPSDGIVTIEGAPGIAAFTKQCLEEEGVQNVSLQTGDFKDLLSGALASMRGKKLVFFDGNHQYQPTMDYFYTALKIMSNDDILIFDDVHWSPEMEKAWSEIKKNEQVACTIDLFFIGIVFFRKEFKEKLDFAIRF